MKTLAYPSFLSTKHALDNIIASPPGEDASPLQGYPPPLPHKKFELRYESLKSKFTLILFAYILMSWHSKKNRENYPRNA